MRTKALAALIMLSLLITLLAVSVSAAEPGFTYEASKLTAAVTVDGINSPGEWDDTNTLAVNADSEIFKTYGRWQGAESNTVYGSDQLNVTYRLKWDETNLYILEERFDTNYYFPDAKTATEPWMGDGTLFFLAYDNGAAKWANAYEPFWVNKGAGGKTLAAVRMHDPDFLTFDDAAHVGSWKYAGTNKDNVYTTEIVIPWSAMQSVGAFTAAEGAKFWMTPVIPNQSSTDEFGTDWNQLNFHDRGNLGDANLDEGTNPAEFPVNWGRMVLAAAKPAPATDAPAADGGTAPATPTTPQTGDMTLVMTLLAAASAFGGAVVFKNKK